MTTILQINSAVRSQAQSTALADAISARLLAKHPGATLIKRDLISTNLPHLDDAILGAFFTPDEARSAEQRELLKQSDELIAELKAADHLVIGAPLYNFGVSTHLKAWLDHVARAGVTFHYTAQGPVGHLAGKTAYLAFARGGLYRGTPADTQTSHLTTFLGFLGITDVRPIFAEGLAMGDASVRESMEKAHAEIAAL
jgi:FMN-dependent NADH-azoreductase